MAVFPNNLFRTEDTNTATRFSLAPQYKRYA